MRGIRINSTVGIGLAEIRIDGGRLRPHRMHMHDRGFYDRFYENTIGIPSITGSMTDIMPMMERLFPRLEDMEFSWSVVHIAEQLIPSAPIPQHHTNGVFWMYLMVLHFVNEIDTITAGMLAMMEFPDREIVSISPPRS